MMIMRYVDKEIEKSATRVEELTSAGDDNGAFFFSSRRRHTRFSRDWSSDVCSSDPRGKIQVGQDRSVVDWQRAFDAHRFKEAAAGYSQLAEAKDNGSTTALAYVRNEYRKALSADRKSVV